MRDTNGDKRRHVYRGLQSYARLSVRIADHAGSIGSTSDVYSRGFWFQTSAGTTDVQTEIIHSSQMQGQCLGCLIIIIIIVIMRVLFRPLEKYVGPSILTVSAPCFVVSCIRGK
jgi:hypothetical protein